MSSDDFSAGRFCPGCGEEVGENAAFCGACGQTINNNSAATGVSKSKLKVSHVVLIAGAVFVILILAALILSRGRSNNQPTTVAQNSSEKKISINVQPTLGLTEPASGALTNANVETAINKLTSNLRIGGGLTVVGIQELPQENAARADIRFNSFQYKSDTAGTPLSKDKSTPKQPDVNSPNFYDEMYKYGTQQVQTRNYSGQGFAVLKHYNDGRWVLKEVHWEFNSWVGNVEIQ